VEPYDTIRTIIVLYIGTVVSAIGIVNSALLMMLFVRDKYRHGPTLYLGVLAGLDLCLSAPTAAQATLVVQLGA
jgi:hypothetical protein